MAPPKKESEYKKTFKKDTIVEVSLEDEGFRGSWYSAKVIRTISRKTHKIFVEYHNLMEDDAGSKPLREYVDAILVRPIPPRDPHIVFSLMDDVDAFQNDGWWEGVVTQVVLDSSPCSSSSSPYFYSVFFRCSREQILFPSCDLRLHREWVRADIWIPPLTHLSPPSSGLRISCNGLSKEHASVKNGSPRQNAITNAVDNQDLPFSKNSHVWEMVESMEVLKRFPQKPHFRPLYDCEEAFREGLAIGSMVTFASLVEKISKSQFSDPKSILDGYLEALVDLEALGFDVALVREKLNDMISIKGRSEQAQITSTESESQIMELNVEKSVINEEIIGIDKKIGELMQKRSIAMEKRDRMDAEITVLQSRIDSVKSDLESAGREFLNATISLC